jgi:hypothetical protein
MLHKDGCPATIQLELPALLYLLFTSSAQLLFVTQHLWHRCLTPPFLLIVQFCLLYLGCTGCSIAQLHKSLQSIMTF